MLKAYLHQQTIHSVDIQTLVDQFIVHCYANDHAESTIRTRKTHLKQFTKFCIDSNLNVNDLNNVAMDMYFMDFAKTHSKSTTNASRRILKVFIRWVEGYKEMNLRVKPEAIKYAREPKKLPKALERDIILKAVSSADDQDAILIETCWRAGLRISELVAIREEDISHDELQIHGKGAVERKVYVTDSLAKRLKGLKKGEPGRHIFRNLHGEDRAMGIKAARLHIQRVFKGIGITMHPHQLRHSFAVELLTKGCDIVSIQTMMGHEDITTTQVYLRLFDSQVKSQYKKFMV